MTGLERRDQPSRLPRPDHVSVGAEGALRSAGRLLWRARDRFSTGARQKNGGLGPTRRATPLRRTHFRRQARNSPDR
jgi:hypothetical protein